MKKFNMIDEDFLCHNCNKLVTKLKYSARNHCPHCLYSLHLDINPGDRLSDCKGVLEPIGIENYKKTYKIIFKCKKCLDVKKNIVASDDNFDKIVSLSVIDYK